MRKLSRHYLAFIALFVALPGVAKTIALQSSGLVVEELADDSVAAKAGLQVEDIVISYDGKLLNSPAALQALEQNTFGKNEVVLKAQRGDEVLQLTVPLGTLGIQARPPLSVSVAEQYRNGRTALGAKQTEQALANWGAAAQEAQLEGEQDVAA